MYWLLRPGWQNIKQIDEFGGGSRDGCGPFALMMLINNFERRPVSYRDGEAIRSDMISRGLWAPQGGCFPSQLRDEVPHQGYRVVGYQGWSNSTLSASSIAAVLHQGVGVIFEVHKAYNLPLNQPSVENHFVTVAAATDESGPTLHGYLLNSDFARNHRPPNGGPQNGTWSHDIVATLRNADVRAFLAVAGK